MTAVCTVVLVLSCLVAKTVIGGAATAGASDVLGGIASAIQSGIAWMITQTLTWWVQVPSPDLAADPAVGRLQQWIGRCRRRFHGAIRA